MNALPPPLEPVIVTATRTEVPADRVDRERRHHRRRRNCGASRPRISAICCACAPASRSRASAARASRPRCSCAARTPITCCVLVDGVRINPGTIGSASIQNIAPELIERVEIVKGPRSTLYGSDAIGGVINVITRRRTGNGGSIQAGAGSYDSRNASLEAASAARTAMRRSASRGSTAADSRRAAATRSIADTENLSLAGAARTELSGVELGLRAWHAEGTSEYSDFFVTPSTRISRTRHSQPSPHSRRRMPGIRKLPPRRCWTGSIRISCPFASPDFLRTPALAARLAE